MVKEQKEKIVDELVNLMNEYKVIGFVDLTSLPAKQLQSMRDKLRGKAFLKMAKKRLIKIALEKSGKKDIIKLADHLKGMAAVIFTNENPFSLYKILDKNKSSAPAKAGQTAPKDIVVPAGKTNFAPGPIISELAQIGVKTKVDGGKIAIIEDTIVAKEGDEISPHMALMLTRLGIEPMEIGLNLSAVYEDGDILTKDVLAIDEDKYKEDIANAYRYALNLSVEAGILNDASTELLIQKAVRESRNLSIETGYLTADTTMDIVAKSHRIAVGLKAELKL